MSDKLGDKSRLLHIKDCISEIKDYLDDTTFEGFQANSMMKNACIRQLEIIGEASNRLSEPMKHENDQVEWKQIIGLRNILIHQYFGVDDNLIWEILTQDLKDFEKKIDAILENLS